MAVEVRILVLADADEQAASVMDAARSGDYVPSWVRVTDAAAVQRALASEAWDVVVCVFREGQPPPALRALRDRDSALEPPLVLVADAFEEAAEAAQRLGGTICLRGRGYAHLGPALDGALRARRQRREREKHAAFERGQQTILENIATGQPLADVLEQIVVLIEQQGEGMLCSILLLDAEAGRVRHGAAPHLPYAFVEAIDGAAIGPREGSCGAAAYLGEAVVVEDIGTHPNWTAYRHLALPVGLRACWSSPIFSAAEGGVLGTFAMYYGEMRAPSDSERMWVARATHLAAIAISRDRAERMIRQADLRYRQIVDTAHEGIWLIDADARTLFVNRRTSALLGYAASELLGRRIVDFMDDASRLAAEGSFLERLRAASGQQEFRFRRRDGSFFWALVSGSPIRDEQGQVIGALGMITDISELKQTENALRKSEAEFRVVFENAATGLALLSDDGRVQRSNPALQRFLGYGGAELHAMTFVELEHPDDRRVENGFHVALLNREREAFRSEKRYVRKNGDVVWGRLTASLVEPCEAVPRSVIVMVEDVTERRQLEEAVRTSERLRTLMYSAVTDVLFYLGVEVEDEYRFLSVNPAFLRATGLREQRVIGRSVREVIPEPSLSAVLAHYRRAIHERRTISWDEVTSYPAGKKYGEVSITPIFDAAGVCTNLVGTVHDVTERRLSEERVAAQAALLDKANDAILVRSLDGTVEYWNQGAERLYGWSSAEALGKKLSASLNRDQAAVARAQTRLLESGAWSGELSQVTKSGRPIIVEGRWTLIRDEHGEGRSVFVINTDATEKKSLQEQLFHTQRLQSMGLLAGGVAHDFNNLLMAIQGNVESAKRALSEGHAALRALSEIETASERASALARRLLTFSRQQEPQRQQVQLAPLVVETLGLLRASLPKQVRVETHFDTKVPAILADPVQIHQIVLNLVTNAAHALGGASGELSLRVEREALSRPLPAQGTVLAPGSYVRFTVGDTGVGIHESTLERIFDPFFTTKDPGKGTGLGLSVVKGIMRSHHGGIVVKSQPGQGTTFTLYFPAGPSSPPQPAAPEPGEHAAT